MDSRILFFGAKENEYVNKVLAHLSCNFNDVTSYLGDWGDPLPEDLSRWEGEYVISYLSRWVLPDFLLKKAKVAAINFHPASPEYPGIGGYNFALYNNSKIYGATCHYMSKEVDTGGIISVRRFPILDTDTVELLFNRTHDVMLVLFYEVIEKIISGEKLQVSNEKWSKKPITRKELNQLSKITPDMSEGEIKRRIRATTYGTWRPTLELGNFVFEFKNQICRS